MAVYTRSKLNINPDIFALKGLSSKNQVEYPRFLEVQEPNEVITNIADAYFSNTDAVDTLRLGDVLAAFASNGSAVFLVTSINPGFSGPNVEVLKLYDLA